MSDPRIGLTFVKRTASPLITKPGQKVHVKFNIQTKPQYSVSNYWDSCTSHCCCENNSSNKWFGIGALIGTVGGILAKIFGGKKQAQQTTAPDNTRPQYIPPEQPQTPPTNAPIQPTEDSVQAPPENTPVDGANNGDEGNVGNNGNNPRTKPSGKSPSGWYRVSTDGQSAVRGITLDKLKDAEQGGKSAAKYVLDKVLGSKLQQLNPNQRAQLLNEIIKKNPSVFDGRGNLKESPDITKLDVPSKDWIEKNISGIKVMEKGTNGINKVKVDKEPEGQKTIMGDNGYYAVITTDPETNKKSVKFYAPSENAIVINKDNGKSEKVGTRNITPASFMKRCPHIYNQVMAELKKP